MGFSADHTDGPSQTHLPGPNVVTPELVDEVGIQIADHVKVKADADRRWRSTTCWRVHCSTSVISSTL